VLESTSGKVLRATDPTVQGYVDWIKSADKQPPGGTYLPIVRLPHRPGVHLDVLKRLNDLSASTQLFAGNRDAYLYLLSELVGNIYEHAAASRAFVTAQFYPKKGLIEACFMDDGVTIAGSLASGAGAVYPPGRAHEAILDALRGKSAKGGGERGFGLRSSARVVNGLGGDMLIVSGRGSVVLGARGDRSVYSMSADDGLSGTLVSFRLRESSKKIKLLELVDE
jgi:hypothetical protein